MKVCMDDFSVYGNSFDDCLANLEKVLVTYEEVNLVLNWEKCHFMVQKGIVLGHMVSSQGIEVDRVNVEVIEKLLPPVKVLRLIGLTELLAKDVPFVFSEDCLLFRN